MKYRVAILYICTGKYDVFWKDFYDSYEKYFLTNSEKDYFVFTDAESIYREENANVHKIYQESLGWPDNTLKRFHIFSTIESQLETFDFIFFMNANCQCVNLITEEEFLPQEEGLLVVQHPGYYNKDCTDYDYDRNPKSEAYIPVGTGKYYICGGVNGGKAKSYLELITTLKEKVDMDESNHVIAKWHDESHINKYILENLDYRILTPSYCYPEDWKLPFAPKILIRDKSKWIDVVAVKNKGIQRIIIRVKSAVKRLLGR